MCSCCEDDVSSSVHGKDKAGVYSRTRTHNSAVRRHTVSSDVNATAVGII